MDLIGAAFIVTVHQNDLGPDLVLFPALEMLNPSKAATASVTSTTTITPATIGIEAAVSSTPLKGPCGRIWKMKEISTAQLGAAARTNASSSVKLSRMICGQRLQASTPHLGSPGRLCSLV
jgi:hypothetical protein